MTNSFIGDAWRSICMFIDSVLYNLVALLYRLFYLVANSEFLKNSTVVKDVYSRVSLFLGIFMLFSLSISFINMLVDPDKMNDKERGLGKIITRVIVVIVMLGMVNPIFEEAFELQSIILKEDLPGKIITGKTSQQTYSSEATGYKFAKNIFSAFVRDDFPPTLSSVSTYGTYESYDDLLGAVGNVASDDHVENFSIFSNYIISRDVAQSGYALEYTYIISGVAAGIIIWILINYIFSCAIRVAQLAFLRLIAPIPIMSYMTKSGEDKFKKWIKQCVTTYLDLFIRLIIITFSIFLIELINEEGTIQINSLETTAMQGYIKVIITLGLLLFAKKVPDLIKELFPSAGAASGDFGLSLKNRFKDTLAGKGLAVAGGAALLGAKKLVAGIDSKAHGKGFFAGTRKVQGNGLLSKFQKGWREITPYASEDKDNRLQGRGELSALGNSYDSGEKIREKIGNVKFDENTDEAVFKNAGIKSSKWISAFKYEKRTKSELEQAEARLKTAESTGVGIDSALEAYRKAEGAHNIAQKELEINNKIFASDAEKMADIKFYDRNKGRRPGSRGSDRTSSSTSNGNTAQAPNVTGATGNGVTQNNSSSVTRDYGNLDDGAE